MNKLNLPSFNYRLRQTGNNFYIFDIIRKKYILLTPEEWVRQHTLHFLINQGEYPKSLIKVESGIFYNKKPKRIDIIISDSNGSPILLVECKASHISIDKSTINQIFQYNSCSKAKLIFITNGLTHLCYKLCEISKSYKQIINIPKYENIL